MREKLAATSCPFCGEVPFRPEKSLSWNPSGSAWSQWSHEGLVKEFNDRLQHGFMNLDGSFTIPNSAAGDLLKLAILIQSKNSQHE
jgi:hypothetical protein